MLAPVIIFVYNRPCHTKKTIEALAENDLAKDSEIYIYSDGPKSQDLTSRKSVKETRDYLDKMKDKKYFKKTEIYKSSENKGLANSVVIGVSAIIKKYKKVIVLEDDLLTSNYFLTFMNQALDFYEDSNNVWSISGYNLPINIPKNYNHDVYKSYRASSWGWATWENMWELVDWEVKDYDDFKWNLKKRKNFNRGGLDLSFMLDDQMAGRIDSWAIRWCYSQFNREKLTIYPVKSFIKNIGLDGTGTHSGITEKYNSDISGDSNFTLSKVDLNDNILKSFKYYYMTRFKHILYKPKQLLKSVLTKLTQFREEEKVV